MDESIPWRNESDKNDAAGSKKRLRLDSGGMAAHEAAVIALRNLASSGKGGANEGPTEEPRPSGDGEVARYGGI